MYDLKTLDGSTATVDQEALDALDASLRGGVYLQGTSEYESARTTWNSMFERYPGFVIRAMGASDVQKAVNFVRDAGLMISVRSGGHQIAGHAVADETVMLDLSQMRSVHVDPVNKTARTAASSRARSSASGTPNAWRH